MHQNEPNYANLLTLNKRLAMKRQERFKKNATLVRDDLRATHVWEVSKPYFKLSRSTGRLGRPPRQTAAPTDHWRVNILIPGVPSRNCMQCPKWKGASETDIYKKILRKKKLEGNLAWQCSNRNNRRRSKVKQNW